MLIIKKLACLLIILFLAACHHNNAEQVASLHTFSPSLAVHEVWRTSVGNGVHKEYFKLTPVVVGDQIYTSSYNGRVTAVNTHSGKRIWASRTKQHVTSGVGADADRVYVGTKSAQMFALGRVDGRVVWQAPVANEVLVTPNASSSVVVVKSVDDRLYGFNKETGQQVWTYHEQTPSLILRGGNAPQVSGPFLVVGFANGQLGVFNVATGQLLWKRAIAEPQGLSLIEQMVDVGDSLVVTDNTIYAATYQGVISAVNLRTGQTIWEQKVSSYAGLATDSRNVYVTDSDSNLWAFNRRTGELAWKQDKLSGRGLTGPAIVGNALVVGDNKGYVHWLSTEDGRFVARERASRGGVLATPVVSGRDVYVYTNSGVLVKYRM